REDIDKNSNHKKQIPNIYQAIIFISKYSTRLSPDKQDGLPLLPNHYPKREYRLPSEAEWEYACRAGTTTPFYFGETITGELAKYNVSESYAEEAKGEYRDGTTPVGQFPPNAFGLYDMHGNVWEWCADTWHDNYDGAPTDGSVWIENGNDNRSPSRGGCCGNSPDLCRSAYRYDDDRSAYGYDFGFRVVCGAGRTL
ncbi:MAG: formylglycine-generating enzyme family protein, partial [Microcystis sp. LE19-338.1B]|nr:formylglycine-generating enzyme family protein [Microcystis sp. LE19-338.1B]MCZ8360112.1 formylglycine-generating enzyme family protein [Microcystis sp. LE19-388.1G]